MEKEWREKRENEKLSGKDRRGWRRKEREREAGSREEKRKRKV